MRKYPKRPVPSVGGIIFNPEGSVLLIRRKKPPEKGKWSIPGGVIRRGENLHEALKREVFEECMLNVKVGPLLSACSRIIKTKKGGIIYHFVILDYLCRYQGGSPKARSDAIDARWVKVNEIDKYPCTEGIKEVIVKAWEKNNRSNQSTTSYGEKNGF